MGLIDEFRNTLGSEDAKVWHERVAEQRHLLLKASDDCYNTLAPAPAAAPRNVETATKRIEDLATFVEALPLAEHVGRLLGEVPDRTDSTPSGSRPVNGQVEMLHRQIDVLSHRIKALHALVQQLGAV